MRIQSTTRWLAAALSLGLGGARGADQRLIDKSAVTFRDTDFEIFGNRDTSVPVFVLEDPAGQQLFRTFNWESKSGLRVEKVDLWVLKRDGPQKVVEGIVQEEDHKNGNGGGAANSIGGKPPDTKPTTTSPLLTENTMTVPEPGSTLPPITGQNERRSIFINSNITVNASSYEGGGAMTILDVTKLQVYASLPLYLGAVWSGNGWQGESYSRAFGVVNSDAGYREIDLDRFRNRSVVQPEVSSTASTPLGTPKGTPTLLPVPTDQSERAPNEGLAKGAIIGIAVACGVFGLLLIGAGIWFLIRRRNKQAANNHLGSPGRPYGVDRSRTEDLIAEKEASAGGADPSPHSPYSDDGVVLVPASTSGDPYLHEGNPVVPMGVGGAAAAPGLSQHHQARSYTPYSDHGSLGGGAVANGSPSTHAASIVHSTHDDTSRAGMGSPTAGRATPHSSLSPRYAHLVEEGMTEDEIRRLEDEERQLDAAIEQARAR